MIGPFEWLQPHFYAGADVIVCRAFKSDSRRALQLAPGMHGLVVKVDRAGDMMISFYYICAL